MGLSKGNRRCSQPGRGPLSMHGPQMSAGPGAGLQDFPVGFPGLCKVVGLCAGLWGSRAFQKAGWGHGAGANLKTHPGGSQCEGRWGGPGCPRVISRLGPSGPFLISPLRKGPRG